MSFTKIYHYPGKGGKRKDGKEHEYAERQTLIFFIISFVCTNKTQSYEICYHRGSGHIAGPLTEKLLSAGHVVALIGRMHQNWKSTGTGRPGCCRIPGRRIFPGIRIQRGRCCIPDDSPNNVVEDFRDTSILWAKTLLMPEVGRHKKSCFPKQHWSAHGERFRPG